MEARKVKALLAEVAAVESGKVPPGRVWRVTKRADGTYQREQLDPHEYRRERVIEAAEEALALKVRRKLGISQDRFAALLGISAATLRNWDQKRRCPTGAAELLLRVAERHPDIVRDVAAVGD